MMENKHFKNVCLYNAIYSILGTMIILWVLLCCVLSQAVNGAVADMLTPGHDPSREHTRPLSESTFLSMCENQWLLFVLFRIKLKNILLKQ